MDDTIQVHLKVPRGLWMELRKDAMMRGRSAQGHVLEMFRVAYGVASKVPSVERKEPVKASRVKEVVSVPSVTESAPEPKSELKEGYGWCLACKARPVKLPNILCERCK